MVSQDQERRDYPCYLLDQIRTLAATGCVRYAGTRVTLDVDNLGFGLDEVCACLSSLAEDHFCHSERYQPGGRWHDVYRRAWSARAGVVDDLYIKLRLGRNCLIVDVCSFHRER